jgi:hypothetical protein
MIWVSIIGQPYELEVVECPPARGVGCCLPEAWTFVHLLLLISAWPLAISFDSRSHLASQSHPGGLSLYSVSSAAGPASQGFWQHCYFLVHKTLPQQKLSAALLLNLEVNNKRKSGADEGS